MTTAGYIARSTHIDIERAIPWAVGLAVLAGAFQVATGRGYFAQESGALEGVDTQTISARLAPIGQLKLAAETTRGSESAPVQTASEGSAPAPSAKASASSSPAEQPAPAQSAEAPQAEAARPNVAETASTAGVAAAAEQQPSPARQTSQPTPQRGYWPAPYPYPYQAPPRPYGGAYPQYPAQPQTPGWTR